MSSWIGPLASAPSDVLRRLEQLPSFQILDRRGLSREHTLLFVPERRPTFDAEIFVLGQMFAWNSASRLTWLFSTHGLCQFETPAVTGRSAFPHFELVLATNNSEQEDPFPFRLGVVLSRGPESFLGWDWGEVRVPPLLNWFSLAAHEVASMIKRDGSHFSITDTIAALGPGGKPWTRSLLKNAVLMPATPHMLRSGLSPFNEPSKPPAVLDADHWHDEPGTDRFKWGFYWLLPTSEEEHRRAESDGSWEMFADLVEQVREGVEDEFDVAFDLLRGVKS